MKRVLLGVWVAINIFCLAGCCEKPIPVVRNERTVLIYMAANNSLSQFSFSNIRSLIDGGFLPANGTILIYLDAPGQVPKLSRLVKNGELIEEEVIEQYSNEERATDPTVLTRTLNRIREIAPADDYGLILWSHATGWVPARTFLSPIPSLQASFAPPIGYSVEDYPIVKSFAEGNRPGFGYDEGMEIDELADAIKSSSTPFSFLIFDCCLMGGIEALYALRNVADYVIASPTEILGNGFPYHLIMQPLFMPNPDLIGVCTSFYNFYNDLNGLNRSATISLYRTEPLLELAEYLTTLFDRYREDLELFSAVDIQRYANTRVYYDLDEFILQLVNTADYQRFKTILDKIVLHKRHTEYFYTMVPPPSSAFIPVLHYGGISTYIPLSSQTSLLTAYKETEWNKKVKMVE